MGGFHNTQEYLKNIYENFDFDLQAAIQSAGSTMNLLQRKGGSFLYFFMNLFKPSPSLFNPQPLWKKKGPGFNGWCMRMIDHENQLAFALIIGSFRNGTIEEGENEKKDTSEGIEKGEGRERGERKKRRRRRRNQGKILKVMKINKKKKKKNILNII